MERVLVTGATGFIGYEVAKQLSERGIRPRLLVRRPFRGIILKSLDADLVQGDLLEPQSLKRALAGIDTIIHLGGRGGIRFLPACASIDRGWFAQPHGGGCGGRCEKVRLWRDPSRVRQSEAADRPNHACLPGFGLWSRQAGSGADDGGHGGRIRNALCFLAPASHLRRQEPIF